jgi:hypothetical protein
MRRDTLLRPTGCARIARATLSRPRLDGGEHGVMLHLIGNRLMVATGWVQNATIRQLVWTNDNTGLRMIRSFPDRTKTRVSKLSEYLHRKVLAESSFICRHYRKCRDSCGHLNFYEGQLHHVGSDYDLEVDGIARRIVIVGQEYGTLPAKVGLNERSQDMRSSAEAGFSGRNPHMQGTTTLLRLLLGRDPGDDSEGEQLLANPRVHIFDGFALVNFLLCSAIDGNTRGQSTWTMQQNCGEHFCSAIKILDPTIIVAQGFGVRDWIRNSIGLASNGPRQPSYDEPISLGNTQATLLTVAHPSAPGRYAWWGQKLNSPYLQETVARTVRGFLARK